MSEPLGSPIGSRREETESLFEQLRREWLLQYEKYFALKHTSFFNSWNLIFSSCYRKSKYVNKRESFAYKPLPPQTAVDVAKLWTSSAHVGIIPLEKTSPAEEAESSETKSEDDYDTDSSSTWSR